MLGRNNALVFRARAGHDVSPIQKELLWQAQLCVFPLLTLRSHSSPPSLSGKCLQMNELFCRCASHFIKPPTVLHLFVRQTSASSRGQLDSLPLFSVVGIVGCCSEVCVCSLQTAGAAWAWVLGRWFPFTAWWAQLLTLPSSPGSCILNLTIYYSLMF